MISLHLTQEQLTSLLAPVQSARRAGLPFADDAVVVLHFRFPVALKYQRVQLTLGLVGQVTSDDGKQVTIQAREVVAWLSAA